MPADKPVTDSAVEAVPLIVTFVAVVLHVPPLVASLMVTAEPIQTAEGPVIAAGDATTVSTSVARQLPTL